MLARNAAGFCWCHPDERPWSSGFPCPRWCPPAPAGRLVMPQKPPDKLPSHFEPNSADLQTLPSFPIGSCHLVKVHPSGDKRSQPLHKNRGELVPPERWSTHEVTSAGRSIPWSHCALEQEKKHLPKDTRTSAHSWEHNFFKVELFVFHLKLTILLTFAQIILKVWPKIKFKLMYKSILRLIL